MAILECKVCSAKFSAHRKNHYISRDVTQKGFGPAFAGTTEPDLFDTFDCPNCGCQVIAHERKRDYTLPDIKKSEMLDEIGCDAIADYLKLPRKALETIREAEESGGEIRIEITKFDGEGMKCRRGRTEVIVVGGQC